MALVITLVVVGCAYLIGSIPFGYLIARAKGVDILKAGSGNIGATNVSRVLGKKLGVLVFVLDFAKGALPTLTALSFAGASGLQVLAGLAAFLGHCFPIYLRFRGGKGVATGAGVVTVLMPIPALAALASWVIVLASFRYVSLASMLAAAVLAGVYFLMTDDPLAAKHLWPSLFCLVALLLVVIRHRGNVGRLIRGTENQVKESRPMITFVRIAHVLALGLWFGSAVFFTFVVGLSLFGTFEALAEKPDDKRPLWFPTPREYQSEEFRKEQGTRAAGFAVSPMFPIYFAIQGVCGCVALLTALGFCLEEPSRRQRWRAIILAVALLTVLVGWPIEQEVSALRVNRNDTSEYYLNTRLANDPGLRLEQWKEAAVTARSEFGRWHAVSLILNFGTVVLVAVGMGLAGVLPSASLVASEAKNQRSR